MPALLKSLAARPWTVALLLGLLAELLFLFNIAIPSKNFFDEVHYVPAAQALLELSAPRNIEHPLLGKELIAFGMMFFGDNPWGWRLVPSLFGAATVTGGFMFLWVLAGKMRPAVTAAVLLILNQMVFIQARIAMLDVFLGAFLLWAMVLLLMAMRAPPEQVTKRWIAGSALLGLAVAVKWSAIPYVALAGLAFLILRGGVPRKALGSGLLGILLILYTVGVVRAGVAWIGILLTPRHTDPTIEELARGPMLLGEAIGALLIAILLVVLWPQWWKRFGPKSAAWPILFDGDHPRWPGLATIPGLLMLGVVSVTVYFLTFLPAFFYTEEPLTLAGLIPLQVEMYDLQTQVLRAHTYQSDWWSWPLMQRPIWYFYEYGDGAQRGVLLIGNPLIMWGGLVAVVACYVAWLRERAMRPLAMALLWTASLAIYIVIPKSLGFFYYYYLSGIFLCFALPVAFEHFDRGRDRGLSDWFAAASFLVFAYFYPIISAMPLEGEQSFQNWIWFPSWA